MPDVLVSTTVLAAFLGGVVALFAPCCVSVMLPAYFASSFRSRTRILGMTLVFAAGVGTVILPIGVGTAAVSRLISGHHTLVFSLGGVAMLAAGVAMLAGWKLMLPMPAMRGAGGRGVGSVYALGAFSGVASACCAPVLAGVAAVSGAVSSFTAALAVGVAYVFGMVAPLTTLALVWDRRDWGSSRLLAGRSVTLRVGRLRRTVPVATALSGGLLMTMGALTVGLAIRGPAMPTDGWQVRLTAWLDHTSTILLRALSWIPGWLSAPAVFAALGGCVLLALRAHGRAPGRVPHDDGPVPDGDTPTGSLTRMLERLR
ncbi:cytochrome c biogenesis protein transmembrane region [Candidatus Protofrankia californiensis]|uniref:Cytochrome c biogenesis protein transmembrane region n=1 Tax=Candidatus Protofrankia californiensis TaxID=1839754 RepID=A0A1C3PGH7_9ACTN|nr:cytochrome c biogenesis protein transmembrane region [Candidatus Protofrankia californiensis]